jgi:exonuclease SbcC
MEFPDGVIGIMGPNGAGKSTLIEAISWALYGNKSESRNGREGIKRSGAGAHEECSVELEFELGGVQYRLRRSLKGKDLKAEAELTAGGGVIAKSERAVSQKVEEILGMDHQAFFISVFARQKDLSALSVLTPGERKKLVMRMLQLDVLQDVLDNIRGDGKEGKLLLQSYNERLLTPDRRSRRDVLTEEIKQLEASVVELESGLAEANDASAAREKELEAARGRKEWAALKEEDYRKVERRVLERRKEIEEMHRTAALTDRDLKALKERLASLPELEAREKELETATALKDGMDADLARFEQRKSAAQNLNRVREEARRNGEALSKARGELSKLEDSQESLDRVTANLEGVERESSLKRERAVVIEAEIIRLRREAAGLEAKSTEISSLGPDSLCPTCERQLGDHHGHLLSKLSGENSELSRRADELVIELNGLKGELDLAVRRKAAMEARRKKLQGEVNDLNRLSATAEQLQHRSDALNAEMTAAQSALDIIGEVAFDQQAYRELKDRISTLRSPAERCKALRGEGIRLPQLESRAEEIGRSLASKSAELERAKADLAAVGYTEGDLKAASAAYDAAFHAREAAYVEVSRRASALELAGERVGDRRAALVEVTVMEKEIAERAGAVERLATLEKVMADFKQNVMERVVPTLSEVSSQLFSDMTDSRYGGIELDENYEMQVYDGKDKYPLSRFSGGESDLANLSLRLAISRVLADRSGNDINFLILDEIFGSQDQVRKRNIMGTLNRLEGQFHQIILISHIDDTKDLMSNVITIKELDDGTSTIEN